MKLSPSTIFAFLLTAAGGAPAAFAQASAACAPESDVATLVSGYPLEQTVERLKASIENSGLSVVAVLDRTVPAGQTTDARRDETLIVGHPRIRDLLSTTPLLALDLPIKVLVWEDGDSVKVSYKEPECLGQRYDLAPEGIAYFARVEESAERALQP
jgi:uncharacterized protein (DUF302 family)